MSFADAVAFAALGVELGMLDVENTRNTSLSLSSVDPTESSDDQTVTLDPIALIPPLSLSNTVRGHTLTDLTNGVWYTVTLNAMLGQIPLLTDTLNYTNDQLAIIKVRGTLRNPIPSLEPLPGFRRFFENPTSLIDRIGRPGK